MTAHSQLHEPLGRRARSDRVRTLLRRMSEAKSPRRSRRESRLGTEQRRVRMKKRRAALAFSAGFMGLSGGVAFAAPTALSAPTGAMPQTGPTLRVPAAALRASASLKQALVREEGVQNVVYRDCAGYNTVGIGHLVTPGDGLRLGDRVSEERILQWFDGDVEEAEAAVARLVGDLPLYQHEFDALVDLVYNVGPGNLTPARSPRLNRAIQARDYAAMAAELEYRYAAGQLARGLADRSERRTRMFTQAAYDTAAALPAPVVRQSA